MKTPLLLSLAALLVLPSAASAATVTANIENRQGTRFGPVTFAAARGEENSVTVTQASGRLRFRDSENPVTATGDCNQVNAHTASCPVTEDTAKVKLRDRHDRAQVEGLVEVFGGGGRDVLAGSSGFDDLNGQAGSDDLNGYGSGDELTGGPGPDFVYGGPGDDDLIDGEREGNAAPDLYEGGANRNTSGPDRGDMVIYASRFLPLEINLAAGKAPGNDEIHEIESVEGGAGDDRLTGNADDNHLVGNGGEDSLRGRRGDDFAAGERGDDSLEGGRGDDPLNGGFGFDTFDGGRGDDDLIVHDDEAAEAPNCGGGEDIARSTAFDTLVDCELANSDPLYIGVQPAISGNTATFQVACQHVGGCSGELRLSGPRGEDYGSGTFAGLPDDPETFTPVSVTLTDAALEALAEGVVVEVAHSYSETGGYRAFVRS